MAENSCCLIRCAVGFRIHSFCAKGQRGPKRQPIGIPSNNGIVPFSVLKRLLCTKGCLKSGIECNNALV